MFPLCRRRHRGEARAGQGGLGSGSPILNSTSPICELTPIYFYRDGRGCNRLEVIVRRRPSSSIVPLPDRLRRLELFGPCCDSPLRVACRLATASPRSGARRSLQRPRCGFENLARCGKLVTVDGSRPWGRLGNFSPATIGICMMPCARSKHIRSKLRSPG